jgi:hypothetical protein
VVLGAILVIFGLQFRHQVESMQGVVVGGLLISTGIAFLVYQVRGEWLEHWGNALTGAVLIAIGTPVCAGVL